MYLSLLLIDVGDNPDLPRPGRTWLRNRYRVHQRLCMAFPSEPRKKNDAQFLKPYDPGDFPEQRQLADKKATQVAPDELRHVHSKRDQRSGFLYRIDPNPGHNVAILVLSALKPDWDYAFANAKYLLAAPPETPRSLRLNMRKGARLRFRLEANPTKKVHALPPEAHRKEPLTRHGRRVPVPSTEDGLRAWLVQRAERAGFRVESSLLTEPGYVYVNKGQGPGNGVRLRSARYEGVLEVTDPVRFRESLASGIGPAKAFGFGLLSLAPA